MKLLKWENLNPTLRSLLNPDSDRWSVKAAVRFVGFLILLPLWAILTIWAIVTDTKWNQVGSVVENILLFLAGIIGWVLAKFRSMSGTDVLLICIVLLLMQISGRITEWHDEWESQQPDNDGDDYSE